MLGKLHYHFLVILFTPVTIIQEVNIVTLVKKGLDEQL